MSLCYSYYRCILFVVWSVYIYKQVRWKNSFLCGCLSFSNSTKVDNARKDARVYLLADSTNSNNVSEEEEAISSSSNNVVKNYRFQNGRRTRRTSVVGNTRHQIRFHFGDDESGERRLWTTTRDIADTWVFERVERNEEEISESDHAFEQRWEWWRKQE